MVGGQQQCGAWESLSESNPRYWVQSRETVGGMFTVFGIKPATQQSEYRHPTTEVLSSTLFSPCFPVTYFLSPHCFCHAASFTSRSCQSSPTGPPSALPLLSHPAPTARPLFLDSAQFPAIALWVKDTFPATLRGAAARDGEKKKSFDTRLKPKPHEWLMRGCWLIKAGRENRPQHFDPPLNKIKDHTAERRTPGRPHGEGDGLSLRPGATAIRSQCFLICQRLRWVDTRRGGGAGVSLTWSDSLRGAVPVLAAVWDYLAVWRRAVSPPPLSGAAHFPWKIRLPFRVGSGCVFLRAAGLAEPGGGE